MANDILWSMERKEVTTVILLDMSAAFDTVDHDLLLDILHNKYGIQILHYNGTRAISDPET